jgi:hypothetical protein
MVNKPTCEHPAERLTNLRTRGHNHRQVKHLANRSMRIDVVPHLNRSEVPDEVEQADLMVDDQQRRIVLVDPLELVCDCGGGEQDGTESMEELHTERCDEEDRCWWVSCWRCQSALMHFISQLQ